MIADSIKASQHKIHNNFVLFLVLIKFLIFEKPSKYAMISTMVIAPIKKTKISAVFPK